MVADLSGLSTRTGTLERIWLLRVQASLEEAGAIVDKVMEADPLAYGRYERNVFVSATGTESYRPLANSTTALHKADDGNIQAVPCVELVISIAQDRDRLALVLDAIHDAHHYEEPVIYVQDTWASRANYDPNNTNPNRWCNRKAGP